MADRTVVASPDAHARVAGVLYLIIIVLGLFGELGVRSAMIAPGDPTETARNILAAEGLFRAGFLADSIMVVCDVALAVLLFLLLEPVGRTLSLVALFFRLAQASVLALNLLHYHAALLLLQGREASSAFGAAQVDELSSLFLELHGHGYDLGLILFGAHCLILGQLIGRSTYLPRVLGYLVMAAGVAYLIGSYTRFLLPDLVAAVSPVYLVCIVSELSLCLWLLFKGVNGERWRRVAGGEGTAFPLRPPSG